MVRQINDKGGQEFLERAVIPGMTKKLKFDDAEVLKRLIILCHPDKHGGKKMAIEMTQYLLELRNK